MCKRKEIINGRVSLAILYLVFICSLNQHLVSGNVLNSTRESGEAVYNHYLSYFESVIKTTEASSIDKLFNEIKNAQDYIDAYPEEKLDTETVLNHFWSLSRMKQKADEYIQLSQYVNAVYERVGRKFNGTQLKAVYENVSLNDAVSHQYLDFDGMFDFDLPLLMGQVPQSRGSSLPDLFLDLVSEKFKGSIWCGDSISLYEIMYQAYEHAVQVLAKERIVRTRVLIIGTSLDKGNHQGKLWRLRRDMQKYSEILNSTIKKAQQVLNTTSSLIRRCDSVKPERGRTFLEFEKLVQGYLAHEYNLNADHVGSYTCEDFKSTKHYELKDFKFTDMPPCTGGIYDCKSTRVSTVCPATIPSHRFDGLKSPRKADMGNTTSCENNGGIQLPQWHKWPTLYNIEPCACYCDDINNPTSFRTIDARPVVSNWQNNMVVTGFRFVNDSNVLHLEIQQGKLEKYGYINESTLSWKSRGEIPNDEVVEEEIIILSMEKRTITLNNVTAPTGHAIIGVRMKSLEDGSVGMAILTAPVSYNTGELLNPQNSKIWTSTRPARYELTLDSPIMPGLANHNTLSKEQDRYIKLQASDWQVDGAQTVLPYLDIQEVVTKPPILLTGVGLYYRFSRGHGSLIDLGIQSWRDSQFMPHATNFTILDVS